MNESAPTSVSAGDAETESMASSFRSLSRPEQRRRLIALIEQGRSDEEIGRLLSMSQWQVRNLRYRLGIKKDRGGNVYLEPHERAANGELTLLPSATLETHAPSPCRFSLQGVFSAEELALRLNGLRALIENGEPDRTYHVVVEFVETNPGARR